MLDHGVQPAARACACSARPSLCSSRAYINNSEAMLSSSATSFFISSIRRARAPVPFAAHHVQLERQARDGRAQLVRDGVGQFALVADQGADALGHLVEGFTQIADAGMARQPGARLQVALAHALRRRLERLQIAPDGQRPHQHERAQQQAQRGNRPPRSPRVRSTVRAAASSSHWPPAPGMPATKVCILSRMKKSPARMACRSLSLAL